MERKSGIIRALLPMEDESEEVASESETCRLSACPDDTESAYTSASSKDSQNSVSLHTTGKEDRIMKSSNVSVKQFGSKCPVCDRIFATVTFCRQHLLKQHNVPMNSSTRLWSKFKQKRTVQKFGKLTKHLCETCGKSFAYNNSLLRHQFFQHNISNSQGIGQKSYQCLTCKATFKYSELLRRHRLQHENFKFQCRFCTQLSFTTYNAFRYHTLKYHKRVECKLCDQSCTGRLEYTRHVKTIHPDVRAPTVVHFRGYHCDQCPAVFATVAELDDHVRSRHQGIFYGCPDCGKQLCSRKGLVVHQRLHSQDSKYCCKECQRPFTQQGHLTQHIRVHHPESLPPDSLTEFACPVCGKVFKTKSSIKKHELTKHEGQTYQCALCLKTFQSKSGLHYHQKRLCNVITVALCKQNRP